ncbi:degV family protein [Dehalogenimonas lykanthroporepellens BL-DC-9]|jgi:DegV family protein with EDD domain|nr:degV family protein [Dehalogenimonas lykanthroporepellens BL-DC-9]
MKIVTDSGTDTGLSPAQLEELNITVVPLVVSLEGKSYFEGVNITPEEFYPLLTQAKRMPITSQPSVGTFAEEYKRIAADDPEILSIHMSSGLSGTYNAAVAAAELVPEASITHVDTKTLSAAAGWQVKAAAAAAKTGWAKDRILDLMKRIGSASDSIYTLKELKYLIHGGRISHLTGTIASLLDIKPLIGVEKKGGTYVQLGRVRTFNKALEGLVDLIARQHPKGSSLRIQVLHSFNPEGAATLREMADARFDCNWLPLGPLSLVLGAHTGPSMVGVAYAPAEVFNEIPAGAGI